MQYFLACVFIYEVYVACVVQSKNLIREIISIDFNCWNHILLNVQILSHRVK